MLNKIFVKKALCFFKNHNSWQEIIFLLCWWYYYSLFKSRPNSSSIHLQEEPSSLLETWSKVEDLGKWTELGKKSLFLTENMILRITYEQTTKFKLSNQTKINKWKPKRLFAICMLQKLHDQQSQLTFYKKLCYKLIFESVCECQTFQSLPNPIQILSNKTLHNGLTISFVSDLFMVLLSKIPTFLILLFQSLGLTVFKSNFNQNWSGQWPLDHLN